MLTFKLSSCIYFCFIEGNFANSRRCSIFLLIIFTLKERSFGKSFVMVTFFIRVGSRVVSIIINLNKIQMILAARFILRDFYFCFHYISAKGRKLLWILFPLHFSKYAMKFLIPETSSFPSMVTIIVSPASTSVLEREILLIVGASVSTTYGCTESVEFSPSAVPLCIRAERHTQHHRGCQQHRQRLLVFHFCHASCFFTKPV